MKKLSIYIHIPFCLQRCSYCNFVAFSDQNSKIETYIKAVIKEIKLQGKTLGKFYEIPSVYIGGGSPSILEEGQVAKIISELKSNFKLLPNCEISIEVNPGSINEKKLLEYKFVGINRLSIGGQTLNNKILKILNRPHDAKAIKKSIELSKKNFSNINVDMILALPNQTLKDVKKMTKYLVSKKIQHISPYSLILEPATPLFKQVKQKKVGIPTEDKSVEMYNFVYNYLIKKGYNRYEVSNFSYLDYESKHNLNYWQGGEYLAFGVAGHSYLNHNRLSNTEKLDEYISLINKGEIPVVSKEKINLAKRKEEAIMLRLRTSEGINLKEFDSEFHCNFLTQKRKEIEFLTLHNFISVKNGFLKVNNNAFYVLNSIITKLI